MFVGETLGLTVLGIREGSLVGDDVGTLLVGESVTIVTVGIIVKI